LTPLDWMFVGYSAMFAAIVLYVANLGRRQAAAERDLAALRAVVDAQAEEPAATPEAAAPERPAGW
jgi:CcmD family protein